MIPSKSKARVMSVYPGELQIEHLCGWQKLIKNLFKCLLVLYNVIVMIILILHKRKLSLTVF